MTKEQFMHYCWKRRFKPGQIHRVAVQMEIKDIPTFTEYKDYYNDSMDYYVNNADNTM